MKDWALVMAGVAALMIGSVCVHRAFVRTPDIYVDPDTGCEYLAVGFGAVMRYDETGRNVRGCREGPDAKVSRR